MVHVIPIAKNMFSGSEAYAYMLAYVMMAEPAHERHPGELAVHPLAMPWGLNGQ
jgi:hypothetical protein